MSGDRVSDGLVALLRRKVEDGTPRGLAWPVAANLILGLAESATTPEEVATANEVIVAALVAADVQAVEHLEMMVAVAQLQEYVDLHRDDS